MPTSTTTAPRLTMAASIILARPTAATGRRYTQASHQFWNATHDVLAGRAEADAALARLEESLRRLSRGGRWR